MVPVAIAVAVVAALIVLDIVWRRRRARAAQAQRVDEIRAGLTADRRASDPSMADEDVPVVPAVAAPDGPVTVPADDPTLKPPAAIHMAVTGTHPWAPARVFLAELKAEGYETTVELPDLVVMRDSDRQPVTVREPAGPPGQLVITATPPRLASALEVLVRSLIESDFTLEEATGRDVALADEHGARVNLTVTQLSSV